MKLVPRATGIPAGHVGSGGAGGDHVGPGASVSEASAAG